MFYQNTSVSVVQLKGVFIRGIKEEYSYKKGHIIILGFGFQIALLSVFQITDQKIKAGFQ